MLKINICYLGITRTIFYASHYFCSNRGFVKAETTAYAYFVKIRFRNNYSLINQAILKNS